MKPMLMLIVLLAACSQEPGIQEVDGLPDGVVAMIEHGPESQRVVECWMNRRGPFKPRQDGICYSEDAP